MISCFKSFSHTSFIQWCFCSIAFVSVKIFLKFNPFMSRRHQSIIWLIPLIIPVCVAILFPPQTVVSTAFVPQVSVPSGMGIAAVGVSSIESFSGVVCIGGLAVAVAFLLFMLIFGSKIAHKRFHIITMEQDEYTSLQERVKETAHKLGISEPKVGLVDDLMPNAFTVGYGRNAVLVFSLGLLNMLDIDELTAVVSHELAHIKAKDYLFKIGSYTLNIISFYNPLSYFTASHCQKERELLADEKGAALLDSPNLMAEVLTKIEAVLQKFPKPSLADKLSSGLFLVSPLAHKPAVLASHPQIAQRVQNINAVISSPSKKRRYVVATVLLLSILVCTVVIIGYSTVQVQHNVLKNENSFSNGVSIYLYNSSYPFNRSFPTGIFFADETSVQLFVSSMQNGSYVGCYVDGNGVSHTYNSGIPNAVTVNGTSILLNGQREPSFLNATNPFGSTHSNNSFISNGGLQSSQQSSYNESRDAT